VTTALDQYLQDWNEACAYAYECGPDLGFLVPPEPWTTLAVVAGVCYYVWRHNERSIQNVRADRAESPDAD